MKIIARINENRLLVEMTEREIANLAGHNYERELQRSRGESDPFPTGREYQVHEAWGRLQQQAKAAEQLEGVSKTLAALSDLVTQTKVQFTNATAEAPKTEGCAS